MLLVVIINGLSVFFKFLLSVLEVLFDFQLKKYVID